MLNSQFPFSSDYKSAATIRDTFFPMIFPNAENLRKDFDNMFKFLQNLSNDNPNVKNLIWMQCTMNSVRWGMNSEFVNNDSGNRQGVAFLLTFDLSEPEIARERFSLLVRESDELPKNRDLFESIVLKECMFQPSDWGTAALLIQRFLFAKRYLVSTILSAEGRLPYSNVKNIVESYSPEWSHHS